MNEAILNSAKPAFREAVEAAIEKHGVGRISCFEIEDEARPGEMLQVWMRHPTRAEIHKYQDTFLKSVAQANELLVKALWLIGDEQLRSEDRYTMPVHGAATSLLGQNELKLKKF